MKEKLVEHFQKTGEFRCFCIAMGVLSFLYRNCLLNLGENQSSNKRKKVQVLLKPEPKKSKKFPLFF